MAQASSIEWTESTWNPVTGCTKISLGCAHCYAERMARRLKAMGQDRYRNGFSVTLQPDVVELPLRWKRSRMIFVNSMSDLFHTEVPAEYIAECFSVMLKRQGMLPLGFRISDGQLLIKLQNTGNILFPCRSNRCHIAPAP